MRTITLSALLFIFGIQLSIGQTFNEILGRPTDTSMTVSLLFNQSVDFYIEYGTVCGSYPFSTSQMANTAGTPNEIDLQNLLPNTKYYYRTRYRLSGPGTFQSGIERSFYTQRASGSSFVFTIESDVHIYDKKGCANLYKICLQNQSADHPDFMIDMGDTYGDDRNPATMTSVISDSLHKVYRPLLGNICHSIPYYFCMGNHEGEFDYYLAQTPPNNLAVWGTLWRKFYFANPYPNSFYSGNDDIEPYGMNQPENYYAWTWGDALFVVMDVYRYQNDTSAKPQKWDWTIGFDQYSWLKTTLENSTATYKFVFAHQVRGQGRGGAADATFYEWGGYDGNGTYQFATKRPGWAAPIHQLFIDNGVDVFFHGHDHVFAHEVLNDVVYQEVPMPSDSTYEIGLLANASAYISDTLDGSGHLRVTVTPSCVTIDYVRAYLPADTISGLHHNREVAFSYTVGTCPSVGVSNRIADPEVLLYPNPACDRLLLKSPSPLTNMKISFINTLGKVAMISTTSNIDVNGLANGFYIVKIHSTEGDFNSKVLISH